MPRFNLDEEIEAEMKAAGWIDYNESIISDDAKCIGKLNDLEINHNDTYQEVFNNYKKQPIELIEFIAGSKLKWYQKFVVNLILRR